MKQDTNVNVSNTDVARLLEKGLSEVLPSTFENSSGHKTTVPLDRGVELKIHLTNIGGKNNHYQSLNLVLNTFSDYITDEEEAEYRRILNNTMYYLLAWGFNDKKDMEQYSNYEPDTVPRFLSYTVPDEVLANIAGYTKYRTKITVEREIYASNLSTEDERREIASKILRKEGVRNISDFDTIS